MKYAWWPGMGLIEEWIEELPFLRISISNQAMCGEEKSNNLDEFRIQGSFITDKLFL